MGQPGKCVHGCGRAEWGTKRGLCGACHRDPAVRALYPRRHPFQVAFHRWTALDVARMRALRAAGLSQVEQAARLGLTRDQVAHAAQRFGVAGTHRTGESRRLVDAAIRHLVPLGWTDVELARLFGYKARRTVENYRNRLGLRANPTPNPALSRCWGCDRPRPPARFEAGWRTRWLAEISQVQVSCPTCWAFMGWGDQSWDRRMA